VIHLAHPQDFTLDEKGLRELPQVSESSCPVQFLDVAFICCRVRYYANIDGTPITIIVVAIVTHYAELIRYYKLYTSDVITYMTCAFDNVQSCYDDTFNVSDVSTTKTNSFL
jgi:hypothetical protein